MTSDRLATSVLATGLLRHAESQGGFGAVLAKGDATAGSILLILLERGQNPRVMERVLKSSGGYSWQVTSDQPDEDKLKVPELVSRRRRFDPDLWVLELDVPSVERFVADLGPFD